LEPSFDVFFRRDEEKQMRKLFLTGSALGVLMVPAMAADLAPYYKASAPPVVWSWTGVYIGANLGWAGSSNTNLTNTGTDTGAFGLGSALGAGFIPGTVGVSHNGFIGGGQIGYNWQLNSAWVVGVEADFAGLGGNDSTSVFAFPGGTGTVPFTTTFTNGLDTLGTVRARLGWLWTPALLAYATGGLAYGDTKVGSSFTCAACGPPAAIALSSSSTSTGWTVGAGLEWRFAPAWSVKVEYLYVDLGSRSDTIVYNYAPANTSTLTSTVNETDNIVRVGLNYKIW
jgi:outer membrane immunogenic protein